MPHQEHAGRFQRAVLWPTAGYDSQGEPIAGDPEEIGIRWESEIEEVSDSVGIESSVIANRRIPVDSYMWLGKLADWSGLRPEEDNQVMQVFRCRETPDPKGRVMQYTVDLIRSRGKFPDVDSGVVLMDPELSQAIYNKLSASADGLDEIIGMYQLIDSQGNPIVGRTVSWILTSYTNVTINNSPQVTDSNGNANLRLRANGPLTTTARIYTPQDGEIFTRQNFTFS